MQISDAIDFISDKSPGMLITLKADGRPQSSNIAYALDEGGTIIISLTDDRAKTKNMRRDPRASLHVNRKDMWAYAVIDADVELTPVAADPNDDTVDQLVAYFKMVAGEHDNWDEYRQAMVDDGRLLAKLTPTHAYGMISR